MFSDPLIYNDGSTNYNAPRVNETPKKYTYKFTNGGIDFIVDISQNGSARRKRHEFRITVVGDVTIGGVTSRPSFSTMLIIDEPANQPNPVSQVQAVWHALKATVTDDVIAKLVAGQK